MSDPKSSLPSETLPSGLSPASGESSSGAGACLQAISLVPLGLFHLYIQPPSSVIGDSSILGRMILDEWQHFETEINIQDQPGGFRFVRLTLKSATCYGIFCVDLISTSDYDSQSISRLKQATLHALASLGLSSTLSAYLSSVLIHELDIGLKTKKSSSATYFSTSSHTRT